MSETFERYSIRVYKIPVVDTDSFVSCLKSFMRKFQDAGMNYRFEIFRSIQDRSESLMPVKSKGIDLSRWLTTQIENTVGGLEITDFSTDKRDEECYASVKATVYKTEYMNSGKGLFIPRCIGRYTEDKFLVTNICAVDFVSNFNDKLLISPLSDEYLCQEVK